MTAQNLKNFLDALEVVKKDYLCPICSEFCKNPVTLSKCFHIICAQHFEGLKKCPKCNISLQGCTTFSDERYERAIESAIELDKAFEGFKNKAPSPTITKKYKPEIVSKDTGTPPNVKELVETTKINKKTVLSENTNKSKAGDHNSNLNTSLLSSGSRINKGIEKKNTKGETMLPKSSRLGKVDKITELLNQGANTNTKDNAGYERAIESTIESDKAYEGLKNKAPSSSFIKKSKQEIVAKDSGTPPNVKELVETAKKKQLTVLSENTNKSKSSVHNSNLNISLLSSSSRINKGIEKKNTKGETMLHIACRLGKVDKITELLNQGANTNTKDNAGWTPLHEVVQNGRLDLVRLLLQYNTLIDVPGQSNETPLHEAVRYKHKDIADELVRHGADMNARNCKGETPFQLASPEMKNVLLAASDNILQTQSVNITHMSKLYSELDSDDIRVFCTSQYRTVHNKLKILVKHHVNLHTEPKLTKNVTHLIVDAEDNNVCESSIDVLQGVVSSIWILTSQWVTKSNEDQLEPFHAYEVEGIGTKSNQGAKNARYNKYKQLPGIFDGCHFYLHNFTAKYEISKEVVVTKAILTKLITDAGGVVLRRTPNPESIPETEKLVPYHAKKGGKLVNCSHYIIFKDMYQPMYNMQHLKALCIGWLIECLEKYELCEPW